MDKISVFKLLEWPDAFGVLLLSFSFILLLSPYFSGADFGLFKIPIFTKEAKKWLRIVGPILCLAVAFSFVPIISKKKAGPANGTGDSRSSETPPAIIPT